MVSLEECLEEKGAGTGDQVDTGDEENGSSAETTDDEDAEWDRIEESLRLSFDAWTGICRLYTSDAADESVSV